MRWSVGVEAEADRPATREEIVELADAVAAISGVAAGVGSNRYGVQLLVRADSREEAIAAAKREFARAAGAAGLPASPIVRVEAVSEEEDEDREGGAW